MANGQVGAPEKLTPEEKIEVYKAFQQYVEEESYPTVPGFCANDETARKYKIIKQNLFDWAQFSSLIKIAVDKQEAYTEDKVMHGKMPPAWAIFKLKQPAFGWTDKQEIQADVTSKGEAIGTIDGAALDARISALIGGAKAGTDQSA